MTELSLIPGVRVSDAVSPELRIYSDEADLAEITMWDGLGSTLLARIPLEPGTLWTGKLSVADIRGNVTLQFQFYSADRPVHRNDYPYQVIPSGQPMTGLVDGCWLSLYHWSEEEGRYFNRDLKKLTHEDFARQVFDMDRVGIRGIVLAKSVRFCGICQRPHPADLRCLSGKSFLPLPAVSGKNAHHRGRSRGGGAERCGSVPDAGAGGHRFVCVV